MLSSTIKTSLPIFLPDASANAIVSDIILSLLALATSSILASSPESFIAFITLFCFSSAFLPMPVKSFFICINESFSLLYILILVSEV